MVTTSEIMKVLRTIPDPEMPISIVDLGLIANIRIVPGSELTRISIDVLPTFIGCPALDMIADEITEKLGGLAGVGDTDVHFIHDPPWSVDRITREGREALAAHGVTVPESGGNLPVPCPMCMFRGQGTHRMSHLGPPADRCAPPKATVCCPLAAPSGTSGGRLMVPHTTAPPAPSERATDRGEMSDYYRDLA